MGKNTLTIVNTEIMEDVMAREDRIEVSREAIVKRLRRIEGQIRGLQKMVADERECESIVTQLAAVRSAIDSVGALVLNNYIKICAPKGKKTDSEVYESMVRVVGVWGRVRLGE
jgi:DNA-binding FrmR family transcriptional regulator